MDRTLLAHLSPVWSRSTDILMVRGEGIYLYDETGRRYLDFTSGIGVTSTGHCHPRVVAAIREQAGKLLFAQINIVYHEPVLDLVRELRAVAPAGLDCFFFASSGAEAVEGAVKLAKQVTGRPNLIVFQGSFHGRTHLTMAMTTSKTVYRTRYQPLVPGIFVSPYPYPFHYGWDEAATTAFALRELDRLLRSQTAPEETACLVIEPVLGEGGYVPLPRGFLRSLRELCDRHGMLLVADEIQSGCGRTGRWFAVEHDEVSPDIMTLAKGIASGIPISAVAYRSQYSPKWLVGSHGGTYTANTLACAAAAATLRVIREENLVDNARQRGAQLLEGLRGLQRRHPAIGEVRGLGLMVATEFGRPGVPDEKTAKAVVQAAAEAGLLLLSCGTYNNVVRWIPPLVVSSRQIEEALEIFAGVLDKAAG